MMILINVLIKIVIMSLIFYPPEIMSR